MEKIIKGCLVFMLAVGLTFAGAFTATAQGPVLTAAGPVITPVAAQEDPEVGVDGGTFSGTVEDEEGNPINDALVHVSTYRNNFFASARLLVTSSNGNYSGYVSGVAWWWQILVWADCFQPQIKYVWLPGDNDFELKGWVECGCGQEHCCPNPGDGNGDDPECDDDTGNAGRYGHECICKKDCNADTVDASGELCDPDTAGCYYIKCDKQQDKCVRGDQTLVEFDYFNAEYHTSSTNRIRWQTVSETNIAKFNIYRSGGASNATIDGPYSKINSSPISATGSPAQGAYYVYVDSGVNNGAYSYWYKLEAINTNGEVDGIYGPDVVP